MRYGQARDEWGYSCEVPDGCTAVWGARAIFKPSLDRPLDLLPGRQNAQGADAELLIKGLTSGILDAVQAQAKLVLAVRQQKAPAAPSAGGATAAAP